MVTNFIYNLTLTETLGITLEYWYKGTCNTGYICAQFNFPGGYVGYHYEDSNEYKITVSGTYTFTGLGSTSVNSATTWTYIGMSIGVA